MYYRLLSPEEISRIGEVNREETVLFEYIPQIDPSKMAVTVSRTKKVPPRNIPPWNKTGIDARAKKWRKHLDTGGFLYGAFHEDQLIGFVLLGAKKIDRSAEIVALFVDKDFRRARIGLNLMQWAESKAKSLGANALFLYANPTASAVNFYLKLEFQIVGLISKEIVVSLPGDIIMAKKLAS